MTQLQYTQIWAEPYHPVETALQVQRVFDTEEIRWLRSQGYEPRLFHSFVPLREHSIWTLQFDVPDTVITYVNLRWSQTRIEVDID